MGSTALTISGAPLGRARAITVFIRVAKKAQP